MIFESKIGYSVEWEGGDYEKYGEHDGPYGILPCYELIGGEITAIAIVDSPAFGYKCWADDETMKIGGPVIIPNQKVYRSAKITQGLGDCYVFFSNQSVINLMETFSKNGRKIKPYGH